MIVVRPALRSDAEWVGQHLRSEDEQEVRTVAGKLDPALSVLRAFDTAKECYAVYPASLDKPCALFGVGNYLNTGYGIVWFLATDAAKGLGVSLLREANLWLDHLARHYMHGIFNYADARNTLHLRWCRLTGFTFGDTKIINGYPFRYIHRHAGAVPHCVTP